MKRDDKDKKGKGGHELSEDVKDHARERDAEEG